MNGAVPEVVLCMVLQGLGTNPAAGGQVQPLQPRAAHRHYLDSTPVLWIRILIRIIMKGRIRIRDKLDTDPHQIDPDPVGSGSVSR